MIPTIETIIEDLLAGVITKQQAIGWLYQHAEDSAYELRDEFAGKAMNGFCVGHARLVDEFNPELYALFARHAYILAEEMMAARDKAPNLEGKGRKPA